MDRTRPLVCLLAVLVVLAGVPLGASAAVGDRQAPQQTQPTNSTDNATVNVTAGQQLSTVLTATSDDVQTEVSETGFEVEYENGSEEERAVLIANRSEALAERAEAIREDYEAATEAYEAGELTRSEYAQQLATLNARARNVVQSYEELDRRSTNVSTLELEAAGYNETAVEAAVTDLDSVSGTGPAALLQRFTGTSSGEIELETTDGLSVEVSGEDGEFSREITRERDDDNSLSVTQSAALDTARNALSAPPNASWTLRAASVHEESGYYEFEFGFRSDGREGEAEVSVDGSSGTAYRIEEEVEPTEEREDEGEEEREDGGEDEREDEREDEDEREEAEDRELALLVVNGTAAANETIEVQALEDGEPAGNVTVSLNGEPVGTTDRNGTVAVTLPAGGDVEITAGEGELELELRERDDIDRNLRADAAVADGTVTVTLTYDGDGVANATVRANDRAVAVTDSDGTATFDVPAGAEELELDLVKGEFEAEFEYELRNGTLVQTEGPDELGDEEIAVEDGEADRETEEADDEDEQESDEEEETEEDDEEESDGDEGDTEEDEDTEADEEESDEDADEDDEDEDDGDDEDDDDEMETVTETETEDDD